MYHHDDSYYGSCDSCSGDFLNTTEGFATNSPRGTWNRRPSGVSTMWRLLNVVDTERPWTITGMAFYADEAQAKDV